MQSFAGNNNSMAAHALHVLENASASSVFWLSSSVNKYESSQWHCLVLNVGESAPVKAEKGHSEVG
jgi:hypothetical protein